MDERRRGAPAAIDESLDEFVCPITQEFPQPTALIFLATVLAKDSHGIAQPLHVWAHV